MWQPAQIVYPDVELLLTDLLRDALAARPEPYAAGVHVDVDVPNPRRDRMVIVRSDGGPPVGDVRSLARVGINVYGPTKQAAGDLARLVGALLSGLAGEGPITAVTSVSLPSEVEDQSDQERRYLTAEIHLRGSVLS